MRLFLCSTFLTNETRPAFEKLVGIQDRQIRIASITTATHGYVELFRAKNQPYDATWVDDDIRIAENFGYHVDKFEISVMKPSEFSIFDTYDAIWFEGGLAGYLITKIRQGAFDKKLTKLLKTKVYVGTSAGSMICAKSLDACEWYIGEPEEGLSAIPGLGLIDFQIYPHFQETLLSEIQEKRHPDQEYWLLKDGQAVSIEHGNIQMHGGEITILKKLT